MYVHIQSLWRADQCCLKDVRFSLEPGQALVVQGENGCGKTSLLLAMADLLPFRGSHNLVPKVHRRLKLMHLDGPAHMTVKAHMAFWAAVYEVSWRHAEQRMAYYGLESYQHQRLQCLSFGLSQRLALARLGLGHGLLWLLDEPFAGLDPDYEKICIQDITSFLSKGGSVCLSSHHNPMGWSSLSLRR